MQFSERPLSRQLIRNWLRMYHGSKLGHAQDWTPHLRLTLPVDNHRGALYYRDTELTELLTLKEFRAMVAPVCTIVGSGPSLRFQHLERLRDHSLIYLNGAISRIIEGGDYPAIVAIEDERFIWRHFQMVRHHVDERAGLLLSVSVLRSIAENDSNWLRNRPVFLIDNLLKPYAAPRRAIDDPRLRDLLERDSESAFSVQPQTGIVPVGTIAFTAMQWIMACEPQRIGFAGIDLSNADQPRFYETRNQTAKSRILSSQKDILAHFSLAAARCRERGIRLENYSQVSALRHLGIAYSSRLDEPNSRAEAVFQVDGERS